MFRTNYLTNHSTASAYFRGAPVTKHTKLRWIRSNITRRDGVRLTNHYTSSTSFITLAASLAPPTPTFNNSWKSSLIS